MLFQPSSWRSCRNRSSDVGQNEGFILLQTVILSLLLNLVAFTLVSLTLRTVEIAKLHHSQRQAYWLARSESLTVMKQLEAGDTPTNQSVTVDSDRTVAVNVTSVPNLTTVVVTAKVHQSFDRVYFSYNPLTERVTSWLDASN